MKLRATGNMGKKIAGYIIAVAALISIGLLICFPKYLLDFSPVFGDPVALYLVVLVALVIALDFGVVMARRKLSKIDFIVWLTVFIFGCLTPLIQRQFEQ